MGNVLLPSIILTFLPSGVTLVGKSGEHISIPSTRNVYSMTSLGMYRTAMKLFPFLLIGALIRSPPSSYIR
uniref:Uncharacterized protein n=1 Tax=Babesia bovis TaxID=5865 RepID=S6C8U5_BABBO|nr:hypothetical protein [Babesia bovis]